MFSVSMPKLYNAPVALSLVCVRKEWRERECVVFPITGSGRADQRREVRQTEDTCIRQSSHLWRCDLQAQSQDGDSS